MAPFHLAITSRFIVMTTPHKPLILGSSSAYRKALLARLGIDFECISPDIDESRLDNESACDLVQRLAREKAAAVAAQQDAAVIIASDQVCVNGDRILGKPHTPANAYEQLAAASGQQVSFLTSLCLRDTDGSLYEALEEVKVRFRPLSDAEIYRYIAADQPLDCAGSFKSEALGVTLFEQVSCTDLTALEGLPLIKTADFLRRCGYQLP